MTLPKLLISHLTNLNYHANPGPDRPVTTKTSTTRHDETTPSIPNPSKPNHLQLAGRRLTTLNGYKCIQSTSTSHHTRGPSLTATTSNQTIHPSIHPSINLTSARRRSSHPVRTSTFKLRIVSASTSVCKLAAQACRMGDRASWRGVESDSDGPEPIDGVAVLYARLPRSSTRRRSGGGSRR